MKSRIWTVIAAIALFAAVAGSCLRDLGRDAEVQYTFLIAGTANDQHD